jgi:hypothetical protein
MGKQAGPTGLEIMAMLDISLPSGPAMVRRTIINRAIAGNLSIVDVPKQSTAHIASVQQ